MALLELSIAFDFFLLESPNQILTFLALHLTLTFCTAVFPKFFCESFRRFLNILIIIYLNGNACVWPALAVSL